MLKWNEIAARTATATNPFNQARIMAITQLAVFEAVNAITGGYEPYLEPPTAAAKAHRSKPLSSWRPTGR